MSELKSMTDSEMDTINAELRRRFNSESGLCMLASESVLARDWNTPEEDEAWAHIQSLR